MYGIEIEHEELNQPRRNCLIDEETIGMRFEEPNEDLSWIRSIVKSKQEAKDQRCQARTTNKVELRVRTIKHAFDLGTKGNAQGSEKELMTQCQNESLRRHYGGMRSLNLNTKKCRITLRITHFQGCACCLRVRKQNMIRSRCSWTKRIKKFFKKK